LLKWGRTGHNPEKPGKGEIKGGPMTDREEVRMRIYI